ncbi:MAG: hypothetical protein AB7S77_14925 [Desulfatirhabdiaceae bacterium]
MARVVEAVAPDYAGWIDWKIVITKQLAGAARHAELSKAYGRPMPVPSIIINGALAFDSIPGTDELREHLDRQIDLMRSGV